MFLKTFEYVATHGPRFHYVTPTQLFSYPGFSWCQPWPRIGMYVDFSVLMLLALAVVLWLLLPTRHVPLRARAYLRLPRGTVAATSTISISSALRASSWPVCQPIGRSPSTLANGQRSALRRYRHGHSGCSGCSSTSFTSMPASRKSPLHSKRKRIPSNENAALIPSPH